MSAVALRLCPVSLKEARRYVAEVHRHNEPPRGHKASVGIKDGDGKLRGVGILGRPVARGFDDGDTAEVLRVCTDGVPNGCSMLYGALTRIAWNLGYRRLVTYTLASEDGTSLRASGWAEDGVINGRPWERSEQSPRQLDKPTLFFESRTPTDDKRRWMKWHP